MDRDAGHRCLMGAKAAGFTALSAVGFACWWGISEASYDADCEWEDTSEATMDGDAFEVCAGDGATINIVAFCVVMLAGIVGVVNTFMQSDLVEIKYSQDVPMCCGPKVHFGITFLAVILCIVLSVVAFSIHWIHFEIDVGTVEDDWDGGILFLEDYDYSPDVNLDYWGYDCLSVDPCDLDDDTTACKTFEPLHDASRLYIQLELVNLILLIQWCVFLFHALCCSREWAHPVLIYAIPHVAWIFHLIAVICWATISEVKFENDDCVNDDTEPDEAYDVCIKEAPILIIVQLFIQIFLAAYFTLIYVKRGDSSTVEPQKGA